MSAIEARIEELTNRIRIESAAQEGARNALEFLKSDKRSDKKDLDKVRLLKNSNDPIALR